MAESKNLLADRVIASAHLALQEGNIKEATKLAQQARQLAPEKEETWLLLAYLAEPQEGIQFIREALIIHPNSKRARQAIHYLLKKKQNTKSVLSDTNVSSQIMEANNQLEGLKQSLEDKLSKESGKVMGLESIEEEIAKPESVPDSFETKKTRDDYQPFNQYDSLKEFEIPESLNEPDFESVSFQPEEVKDELILESEPKSNDEPAIQEPQSERPSFIFHSESPTWKIDPVIVSLILLGILVSTITIYVVLKYQHILP